jgi:hypothetical protein
MLGGVSQIAAERNTMDGSRVECGCEVGGGVGLAGARAAGGRLGDAASLECLSNTVETGKSGEELHICANRCKSWFCPHCARIQGPRLRAKLIDRVESWRNPMMLTLTIDPDLFDDAEAAFKHVTESRAIAKVMAMLAPFLSSPGYFVVIEFQENGWPHWHVLCDAVRIPIDKIRAAWKRFVPRRRRHLIRPKVDSMGIVRFSKPGGFKSAKHAALYVSKYLTKYPDGGFPAWVMDAKYRIRRFSTSRGFWGELSHRKLSVVEDDEDDEEVVDSIEDETREGRTHMQRLGTCCRSCSVYSIEEVVDKASGEARRVRRFFRKLSCQPFALADIVREFAASVPELPAFVRGGFVQWRASWRSFVQCFASQVEGSLLREVAAMRLRG